MISENLNYKDAEEIEEIFNRGNERKEAIKKLFVGFANKQKLEHLRYFVI